MSGRPRRRVDHGAPAACSHARRARVAGCRRRAAGWRERKVVIARAFGTSRDRDSGGEDAELVSRRTLLAGKALFTVGEAFVFPWATEGATRPPAPGDDLLVPFSPAWLRSILYSETDPDVKAAAKAALLERARGEERPQEWRQAGEHRRLLRQLIMCKLYGVWVDHGTGSHTDGRESDLTSGCRLPSNTAGRP